MGAREEALVRFRDACQRDPSVVAAFVGGSIAAHTEDDVSDVDLYAVTLEPDYDLFFSRRQAFMHTWARPQLVVDTLNFEGLGFDMLLSGVTFSKYVPTRSDLRQQAERGLNWFWFDYLQFRKQHHRGRSVAAANALARLRAQCASLVALADAEELNVDTAAMNARLAATLAAADPACQVRAVARVHQEIGPRIAAHFGLEYPSEVAELLLRR